MESSLKPHIEPTLREQAKQNKKIRRKVKKLATEKQLNKDDDKLLTWVQKNPTNNIGQIFVHTASRGKKHTRGQKMKLLRDMTKKLLDISGDSHKVEKLGYGSFTSSQDRQNCDEVNNINSEIILQNAVVFDNIDSEQMLIDKRVINSDVDSQSLKSNVDISILNKADYNEMLDKSDKKLEITKTPSCKKHQKHQGFDTSNVIPNKQKKKKKNQKKDFKISDFAMTRFERVRSPLTEQYWQEKKVDMKAITVEMEPGCNPPTHCLMTEYINREPLYSNVGDTNFLLDRKNVLSVFKSSSVSSGVDPTVTPSPSVAMDCAVREIENSVQEEKELPYTAYVVPNNKILLIMRHPSTLFFRGKLFMSVLVGSVEVLGYKINGENQPKGYTIYCPRGPSLLGLQTCFEHPNTKDWGDAVNSKLVSMGMDYSHVSDIIADLSDLDCLLLLEKTSSVLVNFLNLHFPINLFPTLDTIRKKNWQFAEAEQKLQCDFVLPETKENVKLFTKRPEWDVITDAILGQYPNKGTARTMLCGGKSVGKSTFLRYLINRSLLEFKEVLCIDLDPGQAEFTVPGCVSAVVVREPLLGPNFTHLLTPHRMVYLGDVNMAQCPVLYLKAAHDIIEYYKNHPELCSMPCFVNTMGFSKGLGMELMINLLRMVCPKDVIQIQSITKKRNFDHYLDRKYVQQYNNTLHDVPVIAGSVLEYNLHIVPSAAEFTFPGNSSQWGLQAHKMRELVLLSYLSQMVVAPKYSLTAVIPFMVRLSKLKLSVCHEVVKYSHFLSAMNGNLVALCKAGDQHTLVPSDPEYPQVLKKLPICPCLGFGIVRGIDMEEKQLFLITSLPEHALSQVNCLVMGRVFLPDCVRLNTVGVVGHIPYTTEGSGPPTSRSLRKTHSAKFTSRKRN